MIHADHIVVDRSGKRVLSGLDFATREGEIVGIVGPNGSGKSTLLQALAKNLKLSHGVVTVDGRDVANLSRREIARKMAMLPQQTDSALPLSVRDTVTLGLLASRTLTTYGSARDHRLVDQALAQVGLLDLAERLITQLSGGERQRTMIARAIVQNADYLLLDEPTNHLDLHHQFSLMELLTGIEATTIVVLHDLNLASRCCDRVVLLNEGEIVADGPPSDVFTPKNLELTYRLDVTVIEHNNKPHLIFNPQKRPTP